MSAMPSSAAIQHGLGAGLPVADRVRQAEADRAADAVQAIAQAAP
jgi:hypothetical protein